MSVPENYLEKPTREIPFGQFPMPHLPYPNNSVHTCDYSLFTFLPKILFELLHQWAYLWLLFVSAVELVLFQKGLGEQVTISVLFLISVVLVCGKSGYLAHSLHKKDNEANSVPCELWNGKEILEVPSGDLLCGDIIVVRNGGLVPADSVLLGSSNSDNICYVDDFETLASAELAIKFCIKDTQRFISGNSLDAIGPVLHRIVGVIKVNLPSKDFRTFSGKVKLNKSPSAVNIDLTHFLLRGSRVFAAKWVLCCVVGTGMETKTMISYKARGLFSSKFYVLLNKFSLCAVCCSGVLILTNFLGFVITSEPAPDQSQLDLFLMSVYMYHKLVPVLLFLLLQVIELVQICVINWYERKEGKARLSSITSPVALGEVDYVVADQRGILSYQEPSVRAIVFDRNVYTKCPAYDHTYHSCKDLPPKSRDWSKSTQGNTKTYSTLEVQDVPEITEEDAPCGFRYLEAMASIQNPKLKMLLEALTLCNSVVQLDPLRAKDLYEVAAIKCAKKLKAEIIESNEEDTLLVLSGTRVWYRILASSQANRTIRRTRVLVQSHNNHSFLFVKGLLSDLDNFMDIDPILLSRITSGQNDFVGVTTIVYGYKMIDEYELDEIKINIASAKSASYNVQAKLEAIFSDLEKDVKYLGAVEIEETFEPEAAEGVEMLGNAGIGLWIVSKDGEGSCRAACTKMKVFPSGNDVVSLLNINSPQESRRLLRRAVEEFIYQKEMSPLPSFTHDIDQPQPQAPAGAIESRLRAMGTLNDLLGEPDSGSDVSELLTLSFNPASLHFSTLIDGQSFEIALRDRMSQHLLAALLFTSKSVCFCSMLPDQKADVVKFLKNVFRFKPKVVAFASAKSSRQMLWEADLRAEKLIPGSIVRPDSDLAVSSLKSLCKVLVRHGKESHQKMAKFVFLMLYESALVTLMEIFYSGVCGFTTWFPGFSQVETTLLLLITKPPMLYLALFHEDWNSGKPVKPQKYRESEDGFTMKRIGANLIFALIDAFLLLVPLFPLLQNDITSSGYTENGILVGGMIYCCVTATVLMHISLLYGKMDFRFLGSLLTAGVLFGLCAGLYNFLNDEVLYFLTMMFELPTGTLRPAIGAMCCFIITYTYTVAMQYKKKDKVSAQSFTMNRIASYTHNLFALCKQCALWTPIKSRDFFERHFWSRRFRLSFLEADYQRYFLVTQLKSIQAMLSALSVMLLSFAVLILGLQESSEYHYLRFLLAGYFIVLRLLTHTRVVHKWYLTFTHATICLCVAASSAYEIILNDPTLFSHIYIPVMGMLYLNVDFIRVTALCALNFLIYLIIYIVQIQTSADPLEVSQTIVIALGVDLIAMLCGYFLDSTNRGEFRLLTIKQAELEKSENVLSCLLPPFVKTRVKNGVRFIAEMQPSVSIMFCEICDFDQIIAHSTTYELTSLLNDIYQKFDELCEINGVSKIETVGKVYMACTGLAESEQDIPFGLCEIPQAERLLNCSMQLIRAAEQFKLANGHHITIKIGINSGKVIAGVVGFHKPQFSLMGDTVNTASRMCSTAESANSVQVSGATYSLLRENGRYGFEKKVKYVKGKGEMVVYSIMQDLTSASLRDLQDPRDPHSHKKKSNPGYRRKSTIMEAAVVREKVKTDRNWMWVKVLMNFHGNSIFKHKYSLMKAKYTTVGLACYLLTLIVDLCIDTLDGAQRDDVMNEIIGRAVSLALILIVCLLSHCMLDSCVSTWLNFLFLICSVVAYNVELLVEHSDYASKNILGLQFLLVFVAVMLSYLSSLQILCLLCVSISITLPIVLSGDSSVSTLFRCFQFATMIIILALFTCARELKLKSYFQLNEDVQSDIAKTNDLLANMLPQHVIENMKMEKAITEKLTDTALLVADIVGFTAWANEREPGEVIKLLSDLFTEFDKLCLFHKVYKVHTIGDCYVAMGFSGKYENRNSDKECVNILRFAMDMKGIIAKVSRENGLNLDMRIGMHIGEIIGGVVGTNIVRYDVYGKDVLIAFKMEASSDSGKINVSSRMKSVLERAYPSDLVFTENCLVDITSIGHTERCFFVSE